MGILGYPNMDDDNQGGAFGDYSEIYSNYSDDKQNDESVADEEFYAETSAHDIGNGSEQAGFSDNKNFEQEVQQQPVIDENMPPQKPHQKNNLIGYLIVLGLLLIAAVGMFLYKQHNAASTQEQTMGDYFYDKASGDNPQALSGEQTATIDVDLTEPAGVNNENQSVVQQPKAEETAQEFVNDGAQAADSYGRILVRKGNFDNAQMVQSVKDSIDFFIENPELAAATVKAGDDAYELLEAAGAKDAYEKACCGSCDAAYNK